MARSRRAVSVEGYDDENKDKAGSLVREAPDRSTRTKHGQIEEQIPL